MAIYKRDIASINLETGTIHRTFLNHSIGYKDQKADHFGIRVFRDGEPVDLTGVSVQGVFMPPQGDPIAITSGNIVSGNEAEVVLPQACYNYDGQFCLAIKLVDSNNSVTGTMRIVDGMVDNTHASGTVAPTGAVPTYQEVLATYDAMVAATAAANGAIAATYSSSSTYKVGDYCIHDGGLYRCTTAIKTAEAWTSGHWTAAKIGPDVSDLKSAMSAVQEGEIDGYRHVVKWVNGTWDSTGPTLNNNNKRIRPENFISVKNGDVITITNGSYKHAVGIWAGTLASNTVVRNDRSFNTSDETVKITSDGFFIVSFADATDTSLVIDPADFDGSIVISSYAMRYIIANDPMIQKIKDIQLQKNMLVRNLSISSGVWTDDSRFYSICYPVSSGDIVDVFNINNTSYIAGLKSNTVVVGSAVQFSDATGWDAAISINSNMHWHGVIPSDVTYLYIYCGGSLNRLPKKIYVNGYDIIDSLSSNVEQIAKKIPKELSDYEYWGDTSSGKWASIGDNTKNYIAYPISSGDKIEVLTNTASGSTTYIGFLKSYSNPVTGASIDFSSAEGFASIITIPYKSYKSFVAPSDATYLYIYEGSTSAGKPKRPLKVLINGFDIISMKQFADNDPVSIRVMQYNIGKFAFGYSNNPEASTFGLLSMIAYDDPDHPRRHQDYTFDEYVANYRRMLCDYHPDIIGMEEYLNPIDVMVATDPSDTISKSMADMVFNYTYPYSTYISGKQQCIKSKFGNPLFNISKSYSYTVDGTTYSGGLETNYYAYHGRIICVAVNALASTSNNADMAKRAAQLPAILDLFADEEYVFLTFDVNCGGNWASYPQPEDLVTSKEEAANLLTIAEAKGWTFAQGSYLPFEKTWIPPIGSGYTDRDGSIDNIIFKSNGKIVLRDFNVLSDEYSKLSTDHCAIVGDFLLL